MYWEESTISSIWDTANSPTSAGTKSIPRESSRKPKVKRGVPVNCEIPTVPMSRPIAAPRIPLARADEAMLTMVVRPNIASHMYSGGPICRPMRASGAKKNSSTRAPSTPPTTEEVSDPSSASLALPCLVSG